MTTFAIILARGGSVGIPRKNLALVNGKPLIQWSIEAALESAVIQDVYVSSDDDEILDFARTCHAIPIRRPANLADASATSESGWMHVLSQLQKECLPEYFFALQATSPFRASEDFDKAYSIFFGNGHDSLFAVEKITDHYIWRVKNSNLAPDNFRYENRGMRQVLDEKYLENGSFYLLNTKKFMINETRHFGNIGIYEMPKYKSIQIDEPADILIAEALMDKFRNAQ